MGVCRNLLSGDVHGGNLVANAFFEDDSVWQLETGWSISGGKAHCDSTGVGGDVDIKQSTVTESGKKYRYTIKCSEYTSGNITVYSTGSVYVPCVTGLGVFSIEAYTDLTTIYLRDDGFVGSIDYVLVEEIIPEVINTDIEVVKDSPGYVPRFNGSSSKIDCGDYNDLTGDITLLAWIKPFSYGASVQGRILDNGKVIWAVYNLGADINTMFFSSNGAVTPFAVDYSVNKQEWTSGIITRTAAGIINIYINGEFNGVAADQDSGTPEAGITNVYIGNRSAINRGFDGQIPETIVLSGLLTPKEISAYYTATKHLYQK